MFPLGRNKSPGLEFVVDACSVAETSINIIPEAVLSSSSACLLSSHCTVVLLGICSRPLSA